MKKKKIIKISLYTLGLILILFLGLYSYSYYWMHYKYVPNNGKFKKRIAYINPNKSELSNNFTLCNENFIFDYYNPKKATYSKEKNGLRAFILSNYKNKNYSDSGYLNIRFIINCKGEAGRYIIHENNLDLEPIQFNPDLVDQLFDLTTKLKEWNPNIAQEIAVADSYIYISYRIENGEITEIIP